MPTNPNWTREETQILLSNYPAMGYRKLGELLDRTPWSVKGRIFTLGLNQNLALTLDEAMAHIKGGGNAGRAGHTAHGSGPRQARMDIKMTCLGCRKSFTSWDKARNRLCEPCLREASNYWEDTGTMGSDSGRQVRMHHSGA